MTEPNVNITFRQFELWRNAIEGLLDQMETKPSRLWLSEEAIAHLVVSGTHTGSGWRWSSKHKQEITIHIGNINV